MPAKDETKISGRLKVQPTLPPLPANRFYAGIKRKPGPKRQRLADVLQKYKKPPTGNPYRSYTIGYKLRVLSFWFGKNIPDGPTKMREPTRLEAAKYFKIPPSNLTRWKKDEREGKFEGPKAGQRRGGSGGRQRTWKEMERELYTEFLKRRGMGRVVRRGWFRRISFELFQKTYPEKHTSLFKFSNGWFRGFLRYHHISLRFVTNTASRLPADFASAILHWMQFNRRNSQLRGDNEMGLGDSPATIGRYRLQNICNMDQTPLPFEYLEGQTYSPIGAKTIWVQSSKSNGWDKRQGTIQLTVFADGIPRVKPLVFFRGKGIGATVVAEKRLYDSRVEVKFNPTAYANSTNIVEWLEEQIVPVLEDQPTLLAMDLFSAHKTEEVLDTLRANDITVSVIPGGCTGLVQPLDVSINRPFKDILKVKNIPSK